MSLAGFSQAPCPLAVHTQQILLAESLSAPARMEHPITPATALSSGLSIRSPRTTSTGSPSRGEITGWAGEDADPIALGPAFRRGVIR